MAFSLKGIRDKLAGSFADPSGLLNSPYLANKLRPDLYAASYNNNAFGADNGQVKGASTDISGNPAGPYGPFDPNPFDPTKTLTVEEPYGSGSGGGGSAGAAFEPTYYKGELFSDFNALNNAVLADATDEYNRQTKALQQSYENGLISFDQKANLLSQNRKQLQTQLDNVLYSGERGKEDIEATRGAALANQAGYFSKISPDAYQSTQGDLQKETVETADKGLQDLNRTTSQNKESINVALGNVETEKGNLAREKGQFQDAYQNNLRQLEDALTSRKDELANSKLDYSRALRGPSGYSGYQPNIVEYDPMEVISSLASKAVGALDFGFSPQETLGNIRASLNQTNIDSKAKAGIENRILQYLQGQTGLERKAFF